MLHTRGLVPYITLLSASDRWREMAGYQALDPPSLSEFNRYSVHTICNATSAINAVKWSDLTANALSHIWQLSNFIGYRVYLNDVYPPTSLSDAFAFGEVTIYGATGGGIPGPMHKGDIYLGSEFDQRQHICASLDMGPGPLWKNLHPDSAHPP